MVGPKNSANSIDLKSHRSFSRLQRATIDHWAGSAAVVKTVVYSDDILLKSPHLNNRGMWWCTRLAVSWTWCLIKITRITEPSYCTKITLHTKFIKKNVRALRTICPNWGIFVGACMMLCLHYSSSIVVLSPLNEYEMRKFVMMNWKECTHNNT